MKVKYIFIHENEQLTPDTVFYTVYIGNSDYGRAVLQRCQALQFSNDFFFHVYDADTADFLYKIAVSLYSGVQLPLLRLRRVSLSEREFMHMLQNDVFKPARETANLSYMLCSLDSNFYHNHTALWNKK